MATSFRRVTLLLLLAVGLIAGVATAAGTGGRVQLALPVRLLDTRVDPGHAVTTATIGAGAFTVWTLGAQSPGRAVIHPCDEPAPPDEATFILASSSDIKYATLATGEQVCLTSTVPVHVIVDRRGTVSTSPEPDRLQYVPLSSPLELWDAMTTSDEQVLRFDRPTSLGSDATAAVLSLEVLSAGTGTFATYANAYACSRERPLVADVHFSGQRAANVAYADIGPADDLCLFVYRPAHVRVRLLGQLSSDGPNPALLPPSWRYVPGEVPAPSLRAIEPERVLDTRYGIGRSGTSPVEADEVVEITFGGLVTPQTTAVVLNLTARRPESNGFITAWPCGGDRPTVSNLNFRAGDTVPNLVVSKLGPGGSVCVSGTSRTHLIADLGGTFETDGGLLAQPVDPERILDTRYGIGRAGEFRVEGGTTLELQVTGDTVPDGAGAATLNFTAVNADGNGFLTVHPCAPELPTASNLNYDSSGAVANLVTSKLSADGRLCIFASTTTHVIADLAAWYGEDQPAGLVDLAPERFLDTRYAIGTGTTTKIPAGDVVTLQVTGRGDVPNGADAVVVNLTAVNPDGPGFLTAWPCDRSMPVVSNLNYGPGETTPNLATVTLSDAGTVCIYTVASAHLLADVSGYLTTEKTVGQQLLLQ